MQRRTRPRWRLTGSRAAAGARVGGEGSIAIGNRHAVPTLFISPSFLHHLICYGFEDCDDDPPARTTPSPSCVVYDAIPLLALGKRNGSLPRGKKGYQHGPGVRFSLRVLLFLSQTCCGWTTRTKSPRDCFTGFGFARANGQQGTVWYTLDDD
jgi:hypothetical protein